MRISPILFSVFTCTPGWETPGSGSRLRICGQSQDASRSDQVTGTTPSARIIISSEDLVGSQLTIGEKSTEVSFQDLAKHKSSSLDILIIRVSAGSHPVSLSKSDRILFKTRVILDTGQTRKLRVRQ